MMFGFGFFMMFFVISLPVALVAALIWGLTKLPSGVTTAPKPQSSAQACSHCGAGLQTGWTHCPQCGAPASQV